MFKLPKAPSKRVEKQKAIKNLNKKNGRLHTYITVPAWLQTNKYIASGYRANFSVLECITSAIDVHNDTANIWMSLLSTLFFGYGLFTQLIQEQTQHKSFILGFQACAVIYFFVETLFHTFKAHSAEAKQLLQKLDTAATVLLFIASFVPALFFSFYCLTYWGFFYMPIILILGGVLFLFSFLNASQSLTIRTVMYYLILAAGIIPLVHAYSLTTSPTNSLAIISDSDVWRKLVQVYTLFGLAIALKFNKFPEKLSKGDFDYFLASEQLWIGLVSVGIILLNQSNERIYELWSADHSCTLIPAATV